MSIKAPRFGRNIFFLITVLLFSLVNCVYGQTTWTGATSTAWNTAENWSDGLPDAEDDIIIPDVTNNPILSAIVVNVKSITIQAGGLLTVAAGGTINIAGNYYMPGLLNQGTVQNNGFLNVAYFWYVTHGIKNEGVFYNNIGSQIDINHIAGTDSLSQIFNTGSFHNAGLIRTEINSGSKIGIYNKQGNFSNAATGVISIFNTYIGIALADGEITNSGIINIGPAGNPHPNTLGLYCSYGTLNNNIGGQINIDRTSIGISNHNANIYNSGTLSVDTESVYGEMFDMNPVADGIFTNNAGGIFKGGGTIRAAGFVHAGGTLVPGRPYGVFTFNAGEDFSNSIISMDVHGTLAPRIDRDKIMVDGTATLGGTLALNMNVADTIEGVEMVILEATAISGAFSSITGLAANWQVVYYSNSVTLRYGSQYNWGINTWTGSMGTDWHTSANWTDSIPDGDDDIIIPNTVNKPVISAEASVRSIKVEVGAKLTVTNMGSLSIDGAVMQGIWNQGTVENNGSIQIGNKLGGGNYGIFNDGVFNNNTGGQIRVNRSYVAGITLISNTLSNAGTISIGDTVPIPKLVLGDKGTLSNNTGGILKGTGAISVANLSNNGGMLSPGYSPGIMKLNGDATFANNILAVEINGTGTAGITFDQVAISGTATLGGTLQLSCNYTGKIGNQFIVLVASSISGTFSTVSGLPAGWHVVYYPTCVVVIYGLPASTWTGAINSDWNTAGNWTAGVPNAATDVLIPDVTNDPELSMYGYQVKSITVQNGGLLTINTAATLSINGAIGIALLNQGTVQNNGTIFIGNSSEIGKHGIQNEAVFHNNTGARISIDRVKGTGFPSHIYNYYGNFTNKGTIIIGASSGGQTGIYHYQGTFNNAVAGVIEISKTDTAIALRDGAFSNSGIIKIGPSFSNNITTALSLSYGTFSNNAGAQLIINRATTAIANYHASMHNAGTTAIGTESTVPTLFRTDANALGIFYNDTGGIFQARGTIRSANFVQAGGTLIPGSPFGKLIFNASEDLSNSIISLDINGKSAEIDHDRVSVNGTATLGGALALNVNYSNPQNGTALLIVTALERLGSFSSVTGLPANWRIVDTPGAVMLIYDSRNYWSGAVSSDWNTPANWSTGMLPTSTSNVIIPAAAGTIVINGQANNANTVHIMPGASLTINAGADLTIHGFSDFNGKVSGLYNQGTLTVKGVLTVLH